MTVTTESPTTSDAAAVQTIADEAVAEALTEPAPTASTETPAAVIPAVPPRRARRQKGTSLLAVTAISFSLTFVGASVALLAGVLPPSFAAIRPPVDLGVVLLVVPLLALVLAMMAEALRAALRGTPRPPASRAAVALAVWRPGHGEG